MNKIQTAKKIQLFLESNRYRYVDGNINTEYRILHEPIAYNQYVVLTKVSTRKH